jgi:hypothetical protein
LTSDTLIFALARIAEEGAMPGGGGIFPPDPTSIAFAWTPEAGGPTIFVHRAVTLTLQELLLTVHSFVPDEGQVFSSVGQNGCGFGYLPGNNVRYCDSEGNYFDDRLPATVDPAAYTTGLLGGSGFGFFPLTVHYTIDSTKSGYVITTTVVEPPGTLSHTHYYRYWVPESETHDPELPADLVQLGEPYWLAPGLTTDARAAVVAPAVSAFLSFALTLLCGPATGPFTWRIDGLGWYIPMLSAVTDYVTLVTGTDADGEIWYTVLNYKGRLRPTSVHATYIAPEVAMEIDWSPVQASLSGLQHALQDDADPWSVSNGLRNLRQAVEVVASLDVSLEWIDEGRHIDVAFGPDDRPREWGA